MTDPASDDTLIERMDAEDLPTVLSIESESFDDPWPEETFRSELRHCWSECRVLRRRSDAELLGYMVFWRVVDEVHLLNVAVRRTERHHHLGRLLLDYLLEYAREQKSRFVTLEVRRSNVTAIQLYETGGFHHVGVRKNYYRNPGEDALVMMYDCGSQSDLRELPKAQEA
jgi:ribosomal-protein-alanine N-acetyltransferase